MLSADEAGESTFMARGFDFAQHDIIHACFARKLSGKVLKIT